MLAFKLSQLFETTARKTAKPETAHAAEARANGERAEIERHAKQHSDAARRELAAGFERKIGGIVEAVTVAVGEMQGMSASMSEKGGRFVRANKKRRGYVPAWKKAVVTLKLGEKIEDFFGAV